MFSLYPSLFWDLKDKRNLKNLQFWPESLGSMLEYWYIERGLLVVVLHKFKIHCPNSWVLTFPNFMGRRPLWFRDHLWYNLGIISGPGIICSTIWGSFAVQFGDHLRYNLGIIYGTIWGSFTLRGSSAGRDHLRGCTDIESRNLGLAVLLPWKPAMIGPQFYLYYIDTTLYD